MCSFGGVTYEMDRHFLTRFTSGPFDFEIVLERKAMTFGWGNQPLSLEDNCRERTGRTLAACRDRHVDGGDQFLEGREGVVLLKCCIIEIKMKLEADSNSVYYVAMLSHEDECVQLVFHPLSEAVCLRYFNIFAC
ncbi:hypothetical protein MLD38_018805 [Melastoma candidum]|uniref:Uncharacterized protein n=1 Tax=Melastoma candidum TaxID=119954 RepID=A0ACB9QWU6_9MYRT|nr:hypothetical protein MLD38_018805 [Melastoma candidum]